MSLRSRFAPSPTGLLHIGNAYSALLCEAWAQQNDAELLLRIEDIDCTRCRTEFSAQMLDGLAWLGIAFDGDVVYQQKRLALYEQALQTLIGMEVVYPCFCTRSQIDATLIDEAMHHQRLDTNMLDNYPRKCANLSHDEQQQRMHIEPYAWRLDMSKVVAMLGDKMSWLGADGFEHSFMLSSIGDVIVGRKDIRFSYHLCVVVDDALQGITHVIRGMDLLTSTPVHRVLQVLLDYVSPQYIHHDLIQDELGQRLAKSKQSVTLKSLRDQGHSPEELRLSLMNTSRF